MISGFEVPTTLNNLAIAGLIIKEKKKSELFTVFVCEARS